MLSEIELRELNAIVVPRIISQHEKDSIGKNHTQMLINASAGDENARKYVISLIRRCVREELSEKGVGGGRLSVDEDILNQIVDYIYAHNWGLSYLEKYNVRQVDELMIHGTKILYQKDGEIHVAEERFANFEEAEAVIRRCIEFDQTQDINENNCIVQTKRMDGSRVTAVIPRVGKMPYLNIRKFDSFAPTTENMLKTQTVTQEIVDAISILIRGRSNVIVIGEMGAGKTTFLKWMLQFLDKNLIIGILETTFEVHPESLYPDRHWVQLEEQTDYTLQDLFAVMLRMNVDIMMVGESRSYEVNELIKAMSRGHSGSIGTAHSMGALEVVDDFADMVLESGKSLNLEALKYRIARAIDIVVKFRKLPNRRRVCAGIYEIVVDPKKMSYWEVPLFEFEVDEENPTDEGQHVKKNTISDALKKKLNNYGVRMSDIEAVFG